MGTMLSYIIHIYNYFVLNERTYFITEVFSDG